MPPTGGNAALQCLARAEGHFHQAAVVLDFLEVGRQRRHLRVLLRRVLVLGLPPAENACRAPRDLGIGMPGGLDQGRLDLRAQFGQLLRGRLAHAVALVPELRDQFGRAAVLGAGRLGGCGVGQKMVEHTRQARPAQHLQMPWIEVPAAGLHRLQHLLDVGRRDRRGWFGSRCTCCDQCRQQERRAYQP